MIDKNALRRYASAFAFTPAVLLVLALPAPLSARQPAPTARASASLPGGNCVMPPPRQFSRGPDAEGQALRRVEVPRLPALPEALRPRRTAAAGTALVPAIMMDFSDHPASVTVADVEERLYGLDGAPSVRMYYRETSYGQYDLDGAVAPWVTSSNTRNYYTNSAYGFDISPAARIPPYHRNVWGAIAEAVEKADPLLDFSAFDREPEGGDGVVDAVWFVFAGPGAEAENPPQLFHFWSHKFDLRQCLAADYCPAIPGEGLPTDDGVTIGPYVVVPSIGEIGVYCHEFGHILGLPDLYFPDDASETRSPMGIFDLMDAGAWAFDPDSTAQRYGSLPVHLGAWLKYTLGWIDPPAVSQDSHTTFAWDLSLPPVAEGTSEDPGILRLLDNEGGPDWSRAGGGSGRYFLVENRQPKGFDRGLWSWFPSLPQPDGGLLITFVDESRTGNRVNPSLSLLYIVQADGENVEADGDLPGLGEATDFWPRAGHTPDAFDQETVVDYGVCTAELAQATLEDIERDAAGRVSLDALLAGAERGAPVVSPNPVRGDGPVRIEFVPASGGPHDLRVRVFTLSGEPVRVLDQGGELDPAGTAAIWDLRDDHGRRVASGLYAYVAEAGGAAARGVIAIMR